ncbi:MAG: PAS domain-containing protein, partial [Planctomycetes bacterium]|nr:PAS domain-containing protein [Planctomycetota bacterium]
MTRDPVLTPATTHEILERSPYGVLVFRRCTGGFVCEFANRAARDDFPFAREGTSTTTWPELARTALGDALDSAEQIGSVTERFRHERDGAVAWMEFHASRVADTIVVHVTEMAGLRPIDDDTARLDAVFEERHELRCVIGSDGRFRRFNAGFQELLGHAEHSVSAMRFLDLVHEDDRPHAVSALEIALGGEYPDEFEARLRCADGSVRWYAWIVVPHAGKVYAAARDVSAHRHHVARADRQSERLALAVVGSSAGIWDWNLETGKVWRSPRFHELLGFPPGATLPPVVDAWEIRLHPSDHGPVHAAVQAHFDEGVPYDVEYRVRVEDGGFRWVHSRGDSVRDPNGKAIRFAGTTVDIDAQKRMECDLVRAIAEAESANQAKSEFL